MVTGNALSRGTEVCRDGEAYPVGIFGQGDCVLIKMERKNWKRAAVAAAGFAGCYYAVSRYKYRRNGKKDKAGSGAEGSAYEKYVKRIADKALSFAGLFVLAPLYGAIALAVYLDDPGPVLFTQERIGKDKKVFWLHKFRTMKASAPHDVPTHQLGNPEQHITRVGKFLRKYSLDELPQLWDIFKGNMSVIGPRPALWNQDDLVAERDKYGVNSVLPGLTGWAQINGRDELEIAEKAKLDGEYVKQLRQGGMRALFFDWRCFFTTIFNALRGDGVVEGGTGTTHTDPIYPNTNKTLRLEEDRQIVKM